MSGTKASPIGMRVFITPLARAKEQALVNLCPDEIFWIGLVKPIEHAGFSYLKVYDILPLPKQEVSGTSVNWDGTMNDIMDWMIANGMGDDIINMRYFGHSHVNMGVFHSGTDVAQIWSWATDAELSWFISAVHNKKGEITARYDQFKPYRVHVDELELEVLMPSGVIEWAQEQISEKISKKVYTNVGFTRSATGVGTTSRPTTGEWYINMSRGKLMYPESSKKVTLNIKGQYRELLVDGEVVMSETASSMKWLSTDAKDRWEKSKLKSAEGNAQGEAAEAAPSPTPAASAAGKGLPNWQTKPPVKQQLTPEELSAEDISVLRDLEEDPEFDDDADDIDYAALAAFVGMDWTLNEF